MNPIITYIEERIANYEKEKEGRCGEEYTIIAVCIDELQAVLNKIKELGSIDSLPLKTKL